MINAALHLCDDNHIWSVDVLDRDDDAQVLHGARECDGVRARALCAPVARHGARVRRPPARHALREGRRQEASRRSQLHRRRQRLLTLLLSRDPTARGWRRRRCGRTRARGLVRRSTGYRSART